MIPVTIYFPKNSYMVESFNRKLMLFDNAGLIQYWASANMDTKYLNFNNVAAGPKRITLQHLSGTLHTLLGGLAISILVFFFEVFWITIRKIKIPHVQLFRKQIVQN